MEPSDDLTGTTIAFLATEGVEQVELTGPRDALEQARATVHLVSTGPEIAAFHHLDRADTFTADRRVADANPDTYDALVLPGGVANPDALRMDDHAVAFAGAFLDTGKIVAAICHAPWTLIESGSVTGRQLTSFPSLRTDLENAGATWRDEEVVICGGGPGTLITSRKPDDVPAFNRAIIAELAKTRQPAVGGG